MFRRQAELKLLQAVMQIAHASTKDENGVVSIRSELYRNLLESYSEVLTAVESSCRKQLDLRSGGIQ